MTTGGFFALGELYPEREVWFEASGSPPVVAGDLLATMHRVARGLESMHVHAGETIAVVMSNRREFLECYGAAIRSGLYFVAVNWHLTSSEMSYVLADSTSKVVFTEERFWPEVSRAAADAGIGGQAVLAVDGDRGLHADAGLFCDQPPDRLPEQPPGQIMFYTSGTTGRPKGVRKSFRTEAADEVTLTSGIGPIRIRAGEDANSPSLSDEVVLSSGPFYHGLPIAAVTTALDGGGVVVTMDKWTAEGFLNLVGRHRVTHATVVPTMFRRLLALPEEVRQNAEVKSLRSVNHGGAPCPVDVKRRMIEWWGPIIVESYSSTEGAGTSVSSEEWLLKPGTVGRPNPGVVIKIRDDDGREMPTGEQGLVYMTPTLWEFEYHHDPAKTELATRQGMFTVGDIGYLDEDGFLFLCDRKADTIISGGVNIYPAEVEATLVEHPEVGDAAVVGVPNDEWGEEVRAVVELRDATLASTELATELIEFCRARIARFKCPRGVDFVDSLERDPNGKLRKGIIRARYWPEGAQRI